MTDMDMPLPEPDFKLMWRNGEYKVSRGGIDYADCYSADQVRAIVAAEVAKERERICAAIMAKHEAANGQHNLYHCLAVELFGDEAIRAAAPPQCTSAPSEPQ
jgi:hypothetical protein